MTRVLIRAGSVEMPAELNDTETAKSDKVTDKSEKTDAKKTEKKAESKPAAKADSK